MRVWCLVMVGVGGEPSSCSALSGASSAGFSAYLPTKPTYLGSTYQPKFSTLDFKW